MQVDAVGDAVGRAELFFKFRAERKALQDVSGYAIAHMDFGRSHAMGGNGIPGAEPLQGAHRIWAKLQAGADFVKGRGFFKNMRWLADAGEAQPGGKAGYSAAGNEKR